MDVAVHVNWDIARSLAGIDAILNAIDRVLLPMEQVTGTDGVRVTCIRRTGRSRNLTDPGWRTITRYTTYSVLYDESTA